MVYLTSLAKRIDVDPLSCKEATDAADLSRLTKERQKRYKHYFSLIGSLLFNILHTDGAITQARLERRVVEDKEACVVVVAAAHVRCVCFLEHQFSNIWSGNLLFANWCIVKDNEPCVACGDRSRTWEASVCPFECTLWLERTEKRRCFFVLGKLRDKSKGVWKRQEFLQLGFKPWRRHFFPHSSSCFFFGFCGVWTLQHPLAVVYHQYEVAYSRTNGICANIGSRNASIRKFGKFILLNPCAAVSLRMQTSTPLKFRMLLFFFSWPGGSLCPACSSNRCAFAARFAFSRVVAHVLLTDMCFLTSDAHSCVLQGLLDLCHVRTFEEHLQPDHFQCLAMVAHNDQKEVR